MLAFLHTAAVHVDTFATLARELDDSIPTVRHVHVHWLAETLKLVQFDANGTHKSS